MKRAHTHEGVRRLQGSVPLMRRQPTARLAVAGPQGVHRAVATHLSVGGKHTGPPRSRGDLSRLVQPADVR